MNAKSMAAVGVVLVAGALGASCGAQPAVKTETAGQKKVEEPAAASVEKLVGLERQGGSVILARSGKQNLAFIADEDNRAIHVVDLDGGGRQTTPLNGAPAQLVVLDDGRIAASIQDAASVRLFEYRGLKKPLVEVGGQEVAAEPLGLALTPDGSKLLVTSGWGRQLTVLSTSNLTVDKSMTVAREPRAVVVDDDGKRAFVSHAIGGAVSVIDLDSDKSRSINLDMPMKIRGEPRHRAGAQGYALAKVSSVKIQPEGDTLDGAAPKTFLPPRPTGRVYAPMAESDVGDPRVPSAGYYGGSEDGAPRVAPVVGVIDSKAETVLTDTVLPRDTTNNGACLLPRSATVRPGENTLLVACMGIDALVEYDTRGADPARLELRRWDVPSGPTGVAVEGNRAVVWSQFARSLSVIDLKDGHARQVSFASNENSNDELDAFQKGRTIFNKVGDPRIAIDGIACASCHPQGRDDGAVWATPTGPRQTPTLAGRIEGTAPFGWEGQKQTVHAYLEGTFNRLGGRGLETGDLDALATFVKTAKGPARLAPRTPDLVTKGGEIFANTCTGCHNGGTSDGKLHDVGTRSEGDTVTSFDTPSLQLVTGTAPYFHDGRYNALEQLLMKHPVADKRTVDENRALAAFLESL